MKQSGREPHPAGLDRLAEQWRGRGTTREHELGIGDGGERGWPTRGSGRWSWRLRGDAAGSRQPPADECNEGDETRGSGEGCRNLPAATAGGGRSYGRGWGSGSRCPRAACCGGHAGEPHVDVITEEPDGPGLRVVGEPAGELLKLRVGKRAIAQAADEPVEPVVASSWGQAGGPWDLFS